MNKLLRAISILIFFSSILFNCSNLSITYAKDEPSRHIRVDNESINLSTRILHLNEPLYISFRLLKVMLMYLMVLHLSYFNTLMEMIAIICTLIFTTIPTRIHIMAWKDLVDGLMLLTKLPLKPLPCFFTQMAL